MGINNIGSASYEAPQMNLERMKKEHNAEIEVYSDLGELTLKLQYRPQNAIQQEIKRLSRHGFTIQSTLSLGFHYTIKPPDNYDVSLVGQELKHFLEALNIKTKLENYEVVDNLIRSES